MLSHDRREIEYKIADKKVSGQLGMKSVIIQGWPATIFCTTDHRYLEDCADLERNLLYSPQHYFKVPIEDRLFFYPKDVLTALQKKFKPMPNCGGWLHKVWKALREKEGRREK